MRSKLPILLAASSLVLPAAPARAHRIDEYLQATILSLEPDRAHASMRLIPGVLVAPSLIAAIDTDHDGVFSEAEKHAYADRVVQDLSIALDGQPATAHLDAWEIPSPSDLREGLGEIHLRYHIDLPPALASARRLVLTNRHWSAASAYLVNVEVPGDSRLRIIDQKRDAMQSVYQLDYEQSGSALSPPGMRAGIRGWWHGKEFLGLYRLGMRHIAEGTDHLLFLLVLLLPAPLLAVPSCWAAPASIRRSLFQVTAIVTAFTIGHSLTLTLAAMNLLRVPARPVEVLIAVSILVSAVHAIRPLFPGREAWIAAFFGLIHGLAFASTLDRLGLSRWDRLAGILAFNLGIETMQMLVVALVLPSLLLFSRTRAYPAFRIAGAGFAGAASVLWIAERLLRKQTPVDAIVNGVAERGLAFAVLLFAGSLICLVFLRRSQASTVS